MMAATAEEEETDRSEWRTNREKERGELRIRTGSWNGRRSGHRIEGKDTADVKLGTGQ